jgi:hypothetical protein
VSAFSEPEFMWSKRFQSWTGLNFHSGEKIAQLFDDIGRRIEKDSEGAL